MFSYLTLETERYVRLIILLPGDRETQLEARMISTSVDSSPPYECLSYTWGDPDFSRPMLVNGESIGVTPNLASALLSVRSPTADRILWVDAICINQHNFLERNVQVNLMREVFTKASRVIVWLGVADRESERAMKFLLEMGRREKYYGRHHWINSERQGSGTSSECGDGTERAELDKAENAREGEVDSVEDEEYEDRSERSDRPLLPAGGHDIESAKSWGKASRDSSEERGAPRERESSGNVVVRLMRRLKVLVLGSWDRIRNWKRDVWFEYRFSWKPRYVDPIIHPISNWKSKRQWENYLKEVGIDRARYGHIQFGFPVLYENNKYKFFQENRLGDWEALDALLARPWWSRTWVVQEVWSNPNTIIQCGSTTIKWKTFEKAMNYEEAWDDMGDMLQSTSRANQWVDLKRRYSLAIHLSKKRLLDSTLSDLLWNTWDREVTDPRDKVFAMVGLVGKHHESLTKPDYTKSTNQVYSEAARDIIVDQQKLDIFLAANGLGRKDGLPSWVPDWRREANDERPTLFVNRERLFTMYWTGSTDMVIVNGHGYSASGPSPPVFKFDHDLRTIHVSGICVGFVTALCKPYSDSISTNDLVADASALAESFSGMDISEGALTTEVNKVLVASSAGPAANEDEILRNVMRQRRFFVTDSRNMCIGPANTNSGDCIFVIAGCNFPMILRQEGAQYALVGEAYVHHMMAGEVLEMPEYQNSSYLGWIKTPKWQDISIH